MSSAVKDRYDSELLARVAGALHSKVNAIDTTHKDINLYQLLAHKTVAQKLESLPLKDSALEDSVPKKIMKALRRFNYFIF